MPVQGLVADFFKSYPIRQYQDAMVLARQGEIINQCYFLVSGQVNQYDIVRDGREIIVNQFKPSAFFPLNSVLNPAPSLFFYRTAQNTTLRCAPVEDIQVFLHQNPPVVLDALTRVLRGSDAITKRYVHAFGNGAEAVILYELIVQCRRFGKQSEAGWVIQISHKEIASLSGLTRETVNRELQKLKSQGVIELRYGSILVRNLQLLDQLLKNSILS